MTKGLTKITLSFKYALQGWRSVFKSQLNFRVQCVLAVSTLLSGWFFDISRTEWLFIFLNIGLVLFAESVNTAIELMVDFISPGYHETAGKIKDIAAGAVTIAAISAFVTGLIIFLPKLIAKLA